MCRYPIVGGRNATLQLRIVSCGTGATGLTGRAEHPLCVLVVVRPGSGEQWLRTNGDSLRFLLGGTTVVLVGLTSTEDKLRFQPVIDASIARSLFVNAGKL